MFAVVADVVAGDELFDVLQQRDIQGANAADGQGEAVADDGVGFAEGRSLAPKRPPRCSQFSGAISKSRWDRQV